jgi:hypothetical protein
MRTHFKDDVNPRCIGLVSEVVLVTGDRYLYIPSAGGRQTALPLDLVVRN